MTTKKANPARSGITLRHLRSFVALVECGSFTQAAEQMFLTQSSLTTNIQQIEGELGLKLFERTTRKVVPTAVAHQLRDHAKRVLRDFDSFVLDAWAMAEGTRGHLCLAVAPSAMEWLVAPTLKKFRALHPQLSISIRDSGFLDVVNRVLEGEVDFGITGVDSRNPELDYFPLYRDRFGVVSSRDHELAAHVGKLKWSQLKRYESTLVGLTGDTQVGQAFQAAIRHQGLPSPSEEVSSSGSLYSMLSLGNRFTVVPALTARTQQLGKLPFIPLQEPILYRDNCLLTRRLRALSPSAQHLVRALQETLRSHPVPEHVELVTNDN